MGILVVCECGVKERFQDTALAYAFSVQHEKRCGQMLPGEHALLCPFCDWYYVPRSEVMAKNKALRELILTQHFANNCDVVLKHVPRARTARSRRQAPEYR